MMPKYLSEEEEKLIQSGLLTDDAPAEIAPPPPAAPEAQVAAPTSVKMDDEIDPAILDAWSKADRDVALTTMLQGASQIGAGLSGEKVDAAPFNSLRDYASQNAGRVIKEKQLRRDAVKDAIRQQIEGKRLDLMAGNAERANKRLEQGDVRLSQADNRVSQAMERLGLAKRGQAYREKSGDENRSLRGEALQYKKGLTEDKRRGDFVTKVNNDPEIKKYNDRLSSAQSAYELLDVNNPISGEAAKTAIARLSGEVGALSETDIARFGGSKSIKSRLEQMATQAYGGKLTEENRQYLREVVGAFERSVATAKVKKQNQMAKQYSKAFGIKEDELKGLTGQEPAASDADVLDPVSAPLETARQKRIRELKEKLGK